MTAHFGWSYMRKALFPGTTGIFCLFFIPYVITVIFNGAGNTLINKKFDMEMLLPIITSSQIGEKYELETIKAQTIIARSNFYRILREEKNLRKTLQQITEEMKEKSLYCVILQDKYEEAVSETEGKVIIWNQELKLVPYHEISSGQTRDGKEVFHNEEDSYLRSVHSAVDKESKDFLNSVYISKNILPGELEIKSRDSAGYITELLADGKVLEGEAFRKGMGLTSANFTIQEIGNKIRFLCKGKGHGMGFSQYGGNEMAKDSETDEEILKYYFPEMDIVDVKSIQEEDF